MFIVHHRERNSDDHQTIRFRQDLESQRIHEQIAQSMCLYHDQITHLTFRDMHSINLSFESVQKSQHDYAEKVKKEKLYDLEIV
jgi:hypothetical protein